MEMILSSELSLNDKLAFSQQLLSSLYIFENLNLSLPEK